MTDLKDKIDDARAKEKRWRDSFKAFARRFDPAVILAVSISLLGIVGIVLAAIYLR